MSTKIRNIAVLGHNGSGKTTLMESLLYISNKIKVKGEVERKNTTSDFLLEEQQKLTSFSTSIIPIEWNDHKINFLDTPGNDEFIGDINHALNIVKGAIIVIDAFKGLEVGTIKMWNEVNRLNIPAILFINKMDKENIDFTKLLEEIRLKLGKKAVPFCYPIGRKENFEGFVNVVEMKARIYNGKVCEDAEIWEEKRPFIENLHNLICESVAENDEILLEKYLSGEALAVKEIQTGLRLGVLSSELTPIIVGSAVKDIGVHTLLNMLIDYMPAPSDLAPIKGVHPKTQEEIKRLTLLEEPFSAYVFKTIVDPFIGAINMIKINSGVLTVGQEVYIPNTEKTEKINQLYVFTGKKEVAVQRLIAGDIGAVTKVNLSTGHTLCDPKSLVVYPEIIQPNPTLYLAIQPKNKNDEDKLSTVLQKINYEDQTFTYSRNRSQLLIGGQGKNHLDYSINKMKNLYKLDINILEQKIDYKETIKNTVEAEGRYIKQSGGSGYYGVVMMRFSPSSVENEFIEEVFGGSVPKNYFPAVEKGFLEAIETGVLAGFNVVNIKATLLDGKYHSVDSNEMAFKMAAIIAFKEACKSAKLAILEPIIKVKVIVKENFVGDILSDLNKRRGKILGIDVTENENQEITAIVPESEIISYVIDLKAMTQGYGSFSREFYSYEELPQHLEAKVITEYKKVA